MKQLFLFTINLSLFVSIFAPNNAFSSTHNARFDSTALDAFIVSQMNKHNLPGVAVTITQGDEILYAKGFGKASGNALMTHNTPMYIGSLSKSFTALAIMQLYENGELDIDLPVSTYLPSFTISDPLATETITIRNLLNHTSGLSDFGYVPKHSDTITIQQSITYLTEAKLTAPIGSVFQYFNPNYSILGAIVEKVSGLSYGEYVEKYIFNPLKMNNSYTYVADAEAAGLAQGYGSFFGFSVARSQPFRSYDVPSGYLMMSVSDLSKYLRAQLNKEEFEGVRVLSEQGIEEMQSPPAGLETRYGIGWFIYEKNGVRMIEHGGTNEYFHTAGIMLSKQDITIAILINKNSIIHALFSHPEMNNGVVSITLGQTPSPGGISTRLIGHLLLVGLCVHIYLSISTMRKLQGWLKRFVNKSTLARWVDIGSHFFFPIAILTFLPILFSTFLQRGFSWRTGFTSIPDGILWLLVGIFFDVTQGISKLIILLRNRSAVKST